MVRFFKLEDFGNALTRELFESIMLLAVELKKKPTTLWIPKEPNYWEKLIESARYIEVLDDDGNKTILPQEWSPEEDTFYLDWFGLKLEIKQYEGLLPDHVFVEFA